MHRKKIDIMKLASYIILALGLIVVLLPMIYMLVSAFKDNDLTFTYPPELFPSISDLTFDNFRYIFKNTMFWTYLGNTIFVSVMTVVISIAVSTTLGYVFARLYIPGKKYIFGFLLSIMMIPGLALIVPQFELAVRFNLYNNIWGVILFYSAWVTPFSTFLIKGYIEDNVPRELEESIKVDGGSVFVVYRHIILPLTSPVVASISILNFLFPFEELGWATAILKSDKYRTLPVAITMFFQSHARTDWGYVFAMTTLAMIPVLLIYVLLQRYFVSGLASGAIKE